jgi:hypothetical protein
MLSCVTKIDADGKLTCVHKSKNGKYLQQGLVPRFANFVPFAVSHARHDVVMRTCGLGLMHRLLMDTLAKDVHLLLPTLLLNHAELCLVGYPPSFLSKMFCIFLRHPKVAKSLA